MNTKKPPSSQDSANQTEDKIVIADTETTTLRLEIVEYVKKQLEITEIASIDFLEFEKDIVLTGLLEGLVKLKNRTDSDSSKRASRIILDIVEERYDIVASKKNKYLKLRDLSWDKVFCVLPEIQILLKKKPALLTDILIFVNKVKEKCPRPYQYYWILNTRAKDPRSKLIPEEVFLLDYLKDYDKAITKNTKDLKNHYKDEVNTQNKQGLFGIRAAIKSAMM